MWMSEDNFRELSLSFHPVGPCDEIWLVTLNGMDYPHYVISPDPSWVLWFWFSFVWAFAFETGSCTGLNSGDSSACLCVSSMQLYVV